LNKKTVNEQYIMTNPNELLNRVAGKKWLSEIDLRQFFFQCELNHESQKYTAFQTPFGTYSYR